jgi:hypothetical protein
MENDQRIGTCNAIIQHDRHPTAYALGAPTGERLDDIEDPEQNKTRQDPAPCHRQHEESYQLPPYFIDYYPLAVMAEQLLAPVRSCRACDEGCRKRDGPAYRQILAYGAEPNEHYVEHDPGSTSYRAGKQREIT